MGRAAETPKLSDRITIRLFQDDFDKLKKLAPRTGYNKIIRNVVRKYIRRLEEREAEMRARVGEDLDIDLDKVS